MSSETTHSTTVGVVGLGKMGQNHVDILQKLGCSVLGADIDAGARDRFEETYGGETFETATALYDHGVDAVVITTPNRFHEEAAVEALEADIDVLLEKPLAHTLQSAQRIVEAEQSTDAFGMTGFHCRFLGLTQVIQRRDEDGFFGDLSHVEGNYVRRRGIPARGSWFTKRDVAGGGALIDVGVHVIDLSLHLLGYPEVEEVTGMTRQQFGHRDDYAYTNMWGEDQGPTNFDVDDSASAFLRCADGKSVSLEVAWAVNRDRTTDLHLRGSDGGARLDWANGELDFNTVRDGGTDHFLDTEVSVGDADPKQTELRYFLDHVQRQKEPTKNTFEEGLTVQRVVDAIYESSETGRAVKLD